MGNVHEFTPCSVSIPLNISSLSYWTPDLVRQVDAGVYRVAVGSLAVNLTVTASATIASPGLAAAEVAVKRGAPATAVRPEVAPLVDAVLAELDAAGELRGSGPVAKDVAMLGVRRRVAGAIEKALGVN